MTNEQLHVSIYNNICKTTAAILTVTTTIVQSLSTTHIKHWVKYYKLNRKLHQINLILQFSKSRPKQLDLSKGKVNCGLDLYSASWRMCLSDDLC